MTPSRNEKPAAAEPGGRIWNDDEKHADFSKRCQEQNSNTLDEKENFYFENAYWFVIIDGVQTPGIYGANPIELGDAKARAL